MANRDTESGSQDIPYIDAEDSITIDHSCSQVNNPQPGGQAYQQQISEEHCRYNMTPSGPGHHATPSDPIYNMTSSDPRYNATSSDPSCNTTPSDAGYKMAPNDPRYNMTSSDPRYNVTSSDPRCNMTPSDAGYKMAPSDPRYNMMPSDPRYKMPSRSPRYNMTPSDPGCDTAPSDPGYHMAPGVLEYNMTSCDPGYNMTPSGPSYNMMPSDHGYYMAPSDPAFNVAPSALGYSITGYCAPPGDPGCYAPPGDPRCYAPPSDQAWYNQLTVGQEYQQQLIMQYPGGQHPSSQYPGSQQPSVQYAGGQSVQPPADANSITVPSALIPREQDTYAIQDYLVNYGYAQFGTVVTLPKDSNMKPYKSRIIVNQDQVTSKKADAMACIVQSIITILAGTSLTVAMPLSAVECISIDDLAEALIKVVLQIKPAFEIFMCCSKEDGQMEIIADVVDNIYQKLFKGCYRQCFSDEVSFSSGNSNINIDVKSASLADMKADVIVCSVRQDLNLSIGQVASYLLQVAGQTLQEECHSKYPNGINSGEVAITSAGNLKQNGVKYILHCALPKFTSISYRQVVEKIVMKCLLEAEMHKCESVVFPALGTGNLEYPVRDVARAMFSGVARVFATHVKQVTFSVSIDTPSIFKVFSTERNRHIENKLCFDDSKRILPSLIGTISDNYSQIKLNVIQENDMALLPSNVVVVHFSDTYGGNGDIKFSSDLPEATLDQLYFPMEIFQDSLQSFNIMAAKCFKYCQDNRISAICLHASEYRGIPDIKQMHKVSENLEKLLNDENNCIQDIYIALPTIDQLNMVKQKLLHTQPSNFFSWNSLLRLPDEIKSLWGDNKMVWQEITAEDVPADVVLIGRTESMRKCKKLMQKCIAEARQKYENEHTQSLASKTGMDKSQNTPCAKPQKEDDAVMPWTDGHIMQKGAVSAVINSGITAHVSANGNIKKWIKTIKDNFQDVDVNFDENCKSIVVSGLFDAILKFEKYLDTFFPNDPDVDNKTKTDKSSTELLKKDSADSATAVANADSATTIAVGNADSATTIAVGNVQTRKELQAKGANKNIPKDSNPVTLMPVDKKQIEGVAGTSLSNKPMKEPMPNRKLKLRILNMDIIKCSVDCLIISCNQTFSTSHGIMEAVAAAAGNEFRKACQEEVNQYQLDIANCRPVTAGALSCKKIVLVRGSQNIPYKKQQLCKLQKAYHDAFTKADDLGFHSIAVHAIGHELWKTNMEDCVKQFISAVESIKFTIHNLEFVYFVEKQKKFYELIKQSMLNYAGVDIDIDREENFTSPIAKSVPCEVEAKVAKVEDIDVDAAVSTESQNFNGRGKIASKFHQLGNEEYRKAHKVLSHRTFKVADVSFTKVTSGGHIKCKFVLHTIVPSHQYQKYTSDAWLYTKDIGLTVRNILKQASELCCTSVAIPLIGISDKDDKASVTSFCQAMVQGMKAFFLSAKPCPVKRIVFCSMNTAAVKICQDILHQTT